MQAKHYMHKINLQKREAGGQEGGRGREEVEMASLTRCAGEFFIQTCRRLILDLYFPL